MASPDQTLTVDQRSLGLRVRTGPALNSIQVARQTTNRIVKRITNSLLISTKLAQARLVRDYCSTSWLTRLNCRTNMLFVFDGVATGPNAQVRVVHG